MEFIPYKSQLHFIHRGEVDGLVIEPTEGGRGGGRGLKPKSDFVVCFSCNALVICDHGPPGPGEGGG